MRFIIQISALFLLASCAPGLGTSVPLQPLPDITLHGVALDTSAQLRPFVDERPNSTIVEIDGRRLDPDRDPSLIVEDAFSRAAKAAGIRLTPGSGGIISGHLKEWFAQVRPSFPASTIEASAKIDIEIFDPQQRLMFRSNYTGTTTYQHPMASEERITWALNDALSYAIREVFADDRFVRKLREAATFAAYP